MIQRLTLPVLPLRGTVVYPGVALPIAAARPGTLEAIQRAVASDQRMFAVAQREDTDEPSPEVLFSVGTVIDILQVQRVGPGLQLLVQGDARARALSFEPAGGAMIQATVVTLQSRPPANPEATAFRALDRELRARAAELGTQRGVPTEALDQLIERIRTPGVFADLVAFYLNLPLEEKQGLLEQLDDEERMRAALIAVEREITGLEAQSRIKEMVQEELGERQREQILREHLRAIHKELGEDDERTEHDALEARIQELPLPEAARREAEREMKRLTRISPQSAEYQVVRTYLELLSELPWNERTEDDIDLEESRRILEEDHFGLDEVKDRILEFLSVRKLQVERGVEPRVDAESTHPGGRVGDGALLLFTGPPGVGKTSVAQSIARALGRKYVRISLGGARDEADIRGHRRTYVGAMPGRIIQGLRRAQSKNPVFLLDEVDKLGTSFQGDPSAALLEVLDPAQNATFEDHYLGVPFDLSEVLFIATANYVDRIPPPLRDRMEVVEFSGYTEHEKIEIARRYLLPRQRARVTLGEGEMGLRDDALGTIIQRYTREAGVRQLERVLNQLARKTARRIASGELAELEVTPPVLGEMLGRPRVHPEEMAAEDKVGVATGMSYTAVGGDIIFVEASVMPGKGKLVLTGQLGEVMKESGRAALTYARTHHAALGIDEESIDAVDVHIHVPAGAIPKDGPSAGVTMATALISALSHRAVRRDLAMTGEITLTGRVLPIGGVKEKILGATRAGIRTIVLPRQNEADLEDIPEDIRDTLDVHLVETLDEVQHVALCEPAHRAAWPRPEPDTTPWPAAEGDASPDLPLSLSGSRTPGSADGPDV